MKTGVCAGNKLYAPAAILRRRNSRCRHTLIRQQTHRTDAVNNAAARVHLMRSRPSMQEGRLRIAVPQLSGG